MAAYVESIPDEVLIPASYSDAHVGEAFGETIKGRYLHCPQLGGWLRWDGRRWERDQNEAVFEDARRYVLDLVAYVASTGEDLKVVGTYRKVDRINAIVIIARRLDRIAATSEAFDQHPDLLNCKNGVVDLRTGELWPHDPKLRLTQVTMVDYRPDARHPDLSAAISTTPLDVRPWLRRFFGYCATGRIDDDVMPTFDGKGANGKTTILEAVAAALGEYAQPAPTKLLIADRHSEHPTEIAGLRGKRLITIEETPEGGQLKLERMKMLTGSVTLTGRFMRQDYFDFTRTHKTVVATNHRPAVNSTEHAVWRRLRLISFPFRYVDEPNHPNDRQRDGKLRHRLITGKAQREATLAYVVAGAVRWYRNGLEPSPPSVRTATLNWQIDEDVLLQFFNEAATLDPAGICGSQDLYDAYVRWCERAKRTPRQMKGFKQAVEDHDEIGWQVEWRHTRSGRVVAGVKLLPIGEWGKRAGQGVETGGREPCEPIAGLSPSRAYERNKPADGSQGSQGLTDDGWVEL